LDVVSVKFVLGSHVRGNLTDNTEVTAWNRWGGRSLFTRFSRNTKSYQSSHE